MPVIILLQTNKKMYKQIQKTPEVTKDEILVRLLPNLNYEQFKSLLDINTFKLQSMYPLLLESFNTEWHKEIKKTKGLDQKELYLSFLKIESDGLYDVLEQAFEGNYDRVDEIQDYSQIKLLFSEDYISDLPVEMFLKWLKP